VPPEDPVPLTPAQRSAQASRAAHASWDKEPDKAGRVAHMRDASPTSLDYWLPLVDPAGELSADVRAAHADIAKTAYFRMLGRLGGRPRKRPAAAAQLAVTS
jgi:hypothetical protein